MNSALATGCEIVRAAQSDVDAVDALGWLHEFYTKRGYREVGIVQRQFRYLQFEKLLVAA